MEMVLPFAKKLLKSAVKSGDIAVDATMGNGHDTLFLAQLVGTNGKIFGFDIQKDAIEASSQRLNENQVRERVILIHDGHEHLLEHIPSAYYGKITGAIFNLGYLPGSVKAIITKPATTIAAVEQLLSIMAPAGVIVLVIYHGHEGGAEERDALLNYCGSLDQKAAHVLRYEFINQRNYPPFIIAIEKR